MREVDDGTCNDQRDVFTCQGGLTRRRVSRGPLPSGADQGGGRLQHLTSRRAVRDEVPEAVVVSLLRADRLHPTQWRLCGAGLREMDSSNRWHEQHVPVADDLYDDYLAALAKEGLL